MGDDFRRQGIAGCSWIPMTMRPLARLRRDLVVVGISPWLMQVEAAKAAIQFTFCYDGGVDITVSIGRRKRGRLVMSNVKQIRISEEKLMELRRSEAGSEIELPLKDVDNFIMRCDSTNLV